MDSTAVPSAVREKRLAQWITEYGNAVWRTCYVYLADAAEAEDAMQDTFLKAWSAMAQFEGRNGASERTWLMRIAMNVCADYRRSRWFRHVDRTKVLSDIPEGASAVLPEDRSLMDDILRLPPKYKQVILLYYYQEMTMEETAKVLGCSRSSVFHRLKKAQKILKEALTGGDRDESEQNQAGH